MSKLRLYRFDARSFYGAPDARSKNAGYPHMMCDRGTSCGTVATNLGLSISQETAVRKQINLLDEHDRLFCIAAPGDGVADVEHIG